jgi:hypothetical protein
MLVQPADDTPRSLWREKSTLWLGFPQSEIHPSDFKRPDVDRPQTRPPEFERTLGAFAQADLRRGARDSADADHDPDPPPAAPALRPWPRVFPDL